MNKSATATPASINNQLHLSHEQQIAFTKYKQGHNVFITGPGGTGKSALISRIVQDATYYERDIQVCALTGCAALLLGTGAKTLHSWAGIGNGMAEVTTYIERITNNFFMRCAWRKIKVLVVDEVSMMSAQLFDLIDQIAKSVRRSRRPFGGIQMIFTGDFYQLPPVPTPGVKESKQFCFESAEWANTFAESDHVILTTNFRQVDPVYQRILNQIRCGRLKRQEHALLVAKVGMPYAVAEDHIRPTKIFPTKNKVDYINDMEMNALSPDAPVYVYEVKYKYNIKQEPYEMKSGVMDTKVYTAEQKQRELDRLANSLPCSKKIAIKEGAQVMCRVNLDVQHGICNGSQGIVIGFRTLGLADPITMYPLVRFTNGEELVMGEYTWKSDTIWGIGVCQVPLSLAWAMTIHKSQGATLDRAEVDAGSEIFECGQTYVALSRIKTLDGLFLSSFDVSRIQIDPRAKAFYDRLPTPAPVQLTLTETETAGVPEAVAVECLPIAQCALYES